MPLFLKGLHRFDEFELNPHRRVLLRDGQPVPLTPKAFEVLACLLQTPGEVVTKEQLIRTVWPESFVEEGNLAQHISALRKAFADRAGYIVTVPGSGYQFAGDVENEETLATKGAAAEAAIPRQDVVFLQRVQERMQERTHIILEESTILAPRPAFSRRTMVWAAGAVAAVALASAAAWLWIDRTVPGDHHEVVLADIENTTGDSEFDRILNTALAVDLKQSPYLLIASAAKRQETMKLMERLPQEALTPALAREMCQRIGDQAVLTPQIAKFDQKYLVTLTATDCESGDDLAQDKIVAPDRDSILQSIDTLAAAMRRRLGEPRATLRQMNTPLLAKKTNSLDALKAYTLAHDLGSQGKYQQAIPLFQKAIELDPNFATAYSDLGTLYSNLGERDLAVTALTRAYELRDFAVEQDKLAITSIYHSEVTGNMHEGIRNYETWATLYPLSYSPRGNLSNLWVQVGRADLAIEPGQQAVALAPTETTPYVVLARAQMHAGQLQEAKATCQKAIDHKVDDASIHGLLLEIAFAAHDQAAVEAQVVWSKGKPAEPFILLEKTLGEYAQGRPQEAETLLQELVEKYRRQGLNERADRMRGAAPRMELELGRVDEARAQLHGLPPLSGSTDVPVALALTGDVAQAEAILHREQQLRPNDTLWQNSRGPQIRAAIALAQNKPDEAIQALQPGLPYDLRTFDVPAMRGAAYLAAKQPAQAEVEFHKIVDNPGVEPLSPNFALAHLGLARALAEQQNFAASRLEYEAFFALWKDAPASLPVLEQAHREFQHLAQ